MSHLAFASRLLICSGLLFLASCGGSKSPSAPSTPPPPTTPTTPPPATGSSVKGTVVATQTGQPIANATLTFDNGSSVRTAADGTFTYTDSRTSVTSPYKVKVQADGYLTRDAQVRGQAGAREGVTIDLIRDASPFSLDFYRQFVRDQNDSTEGLRPLRRWTENPRFYIQTVDDKGRAIEPEVLTLITNTIPRAVSGFTGGRLSVAQIERGTEARNYATGWINVMFVREMEGNYCGRATVGGPYGYIIFNDDRCNCGSVKVDQSTVIHEVGHSMGFYHVKGRENVMYYQNPGGCPSADLGAAEKYHVNIAYQRPIGSLDLDQDPASGALLMPGIITGPPVIIVD